MMLKDRIALCAELWHETKDDRYAYELVGLTDATWSQKPLSLNHPWYLRGYADGALLKELEAGGHTV